MNRWAAGALALAVLVGACASSPAVRTEEATQHSARLAPPGPSTLAWSACAGAPDWLATDWECAWVDAPLDHDDPSAGTIEVAVSRPVPEPGDDRRPLVVNPGGPGASGIELAWQLVDLLPPELLDHHYPVGWDPRGVGRSRPAIDCGPVDATVPDVDECIESTGPLLAQVGAADAGLDLEPVRAALGVERLDYLGYSYATALGAVFAAAHPDRVGHFVLDGAIDPSAGDPDGALAADGFPDYAADESDEVVARFHELCDASAACAAGPASADLVDDLASTIRDLPTEDFPGQPEQLNRVDLEDVIVGVTYSPRSWGLAGDALRDGADGDASALAALSSYLLNGYPEPPPGDELLADFGAAHYAIYCADFSHVERLWECEGMPEADPLPEIGPVDVAEPILVVGTAHDPSTPGRHAAEMADALGDAVSITWDGVGHTAFPVDRCVDDAVVGYLVDGTVPDDGLVCAFVDGLDTDAEVGDHLFEHQPWWVEGPLEDVLVAEGTGTARARCQAGALAGAEHRVISHILLGVRSDDAAAARRRSGAGC